MELPVLPCLLAGSKQPDVQPGSCRGSTQPWGARPGHFQVQMIGLKGSKSHVERRGRLRARVSQAPAWVKAAFSSLCSSPLTTLPHPGPIPAI